MLNFTLLEQTEGCYFSQSFRVGVGAAPKMLNLRPWLLAGAGGDRPEYQEYLKGSGGEGLFTETGLALT